MHIDEERQSGTDNRKLTFFLQAYKATLGPPVYVNRPPTRKHHCPSGIAGRIKEIAWWRFHRCCQETCPHRLQGEASSPFQHREQQVLRQAHPLQLSSRCLNDRQLHWYLPLKLSPHPIFRHRHYRRHQCNHSQRHRPPRDE